MNSDLNKYIEYTSLIRELSSPPITETRSAEDYRVNLLESFNEVGRLAKLNEQILIDNFYPLLNTDLELTEEEVELLREFAEQLIDPTSMANQDMPMFFLQSERLLIDAERKGDMRLMLLALDNMVIASYSMLTTSKRLYPEFDICFRYRDAGMAAANRILEYLDPDMFAALPDDYCKETVLVNSRYVAGLFEWADKEDYKECIDRSLDMLDRSIELANDPFYREQVPDYDWEYHVFRALQYTACMTEFRSRELIDLEQAARIADRTRQMMDFIGDKQELVSTCPPQAQTILLLRNMYIAEEISREEYREKLRDLFANRQMDSYDTWTAYANFTVPYEYMLTVDPEDPTEEDKELLNIFYKEMVKYIHNLPKGDELSFLLTFLTEILRNYVEVPGAPTLTTTSLSLMAVLHPPTYVHSLSVGDFSACLTKHLLEREPERFIGVLGTGSVEEVHQRTEDILTFARSGGLLHDVGKLFVLEIIITYGRKLFPSEFDLIKAHPDCGASMLRRYSYSAQYADMARGHHRWYNDLAGYPPEFYLSECENKTMVSILTVADCLDASTDSVGRTYKEGKTLDEYIGELKQGRGTRYAPYLVDLLDDPVVRDDVEDLLANARDNNYRETYNLLMSFYQEEK